MSPFRRPILSRALVQSPSARCSAPRALPWIKTTTDSTWPTGAQTTLAVIETASPADGPNTTRVIEGPNAKLVIDHPTSSAYNAYPNAVFFDPTTNRLFATTRNAQSVLIFDVSNAVVGGKGGTTT